MSNRIPFVDLDDAGLFESLLALGLPPIDDRGGLLRWRRAYAAYLVRGAHDGEGRGGDVVTDPEVAARADAHAWELMALHLGAVDDHIEHELAELEGAAQLVRGDAMTIEARVARLAAHVAELATITS